MGNSWPVNQSSMMIIVGHVLPLYWRNLKRNLRHNAQVFFDKRLYFCFGFDAEDSINFASMHSLRMFIQIIFWPRKWKEQRQHAVIVNPRISPFLIVLLKRNSHLPFSKKSLSLQSFMTITAFFYQKNRSAKVCFEVLPKAETFAQKENDIIPWLDQDMSMIQIE